MITTHESATAVLRACVTNAERDLTYDLERVASNAESTARLLLDIAKTRDAIASYEAALAELTK